MDPRQSISRTAASGVPQGGYNPNNMASAYAMPPYQGNTHLPPINYPQLPPNNPQHYMPQQQQQYRNDLPRYPSGPAPGSGPNPDRYNPQMAPQGSMSGLPPTSMLPQPSQQQQQQQHHHHQQQQQQQQQQQPPNYSNQQPQRSNYPQPLAPAPPRPTLDTLSANYGPPDNRQPQWSGAESMPGMTTDPNRDPTRTHVVGSQGRRGILPSAPGRAQAVPNGMNGSPKGNAVPAKDADGKFPCPNCTKTYLHAKHLKRHMLRHTGDRPYMCVLCNDTFSRSDILKRHFQKCSVRRGNPTGASHLSNPAAHLKKSQTAAAKASTASPASSTTPVSGVPPGSFTTTAMPASSIPATASGPTATLPYTMGANGQGDLQRSQQGQPLQSQPGQGPIDHNPSNPWPMHNARNNQMMYHPTSGPTDHYGMQAAVNDDKRNVVGNPHHMGDEWNPMFPSGGNEGYMNPIFTGYDQSQNDVKKEFESHEGGANGYYIPSTSLGADGITPRATK